MRRSNRVAVCLARQIPLALRLAEQLAVLSPRTLLTPESLT